MTTILTQFSPQYTTHAHRKLNRSYLKGNNFRVWRPIRSGTPKTKVSALPDMISYSEVQLVTWVLPMIIAGRVMDLNYEEIGKGLVALAVFKTCLHVILAAN